MKTISIRVGDDMYKTLKAEAEKKGLPLSAWVRMILIMKTTEIENEKA